MPLSLSLSLSLKQTRPVPQLHTLAWMRHCTCKRATRGRLAQRVPRHVPKIASNRHLELAGISIQPNPSCYVQLALHFLESSLVSSATRCLGSQAAVVETGDPRLQSVEYLGSTPSSEINFSRTDRRRASSCKVLQTWHSKGQAACRQELIAPPAAVTVRQFRWHTYHSCEKSEADSRHIYRCDLVPKMWHGTRVPAKQRTRLTSSA